MPKCQPCRDGLEGVEVQEYVRGGEIFGRGRALRLGESGSCPYVGVAVAGPDSLSVTFSRILSGVGNTALLVKGSSLSCSPTWHLQRCHHGMWMEYSTVIMHEITSQLNTYLFYRHSVCNKGLI